MAGKRSAFGRLMDTNKVASFLDTVYITGRRGSAFHDPTRPTRCWTQPTPRINPTHDRTWRRPPGRPRNNWLDQLRNDSTRPTGELWRRAVDRGHGGATTPLLV